MPSLQQDIRNLINGVTQQPDGLQLENQCEIQENALSSAAEGLKKRYPTNWVGNLVPADIDPETNPNKYLNSHIHFIHRDDAEQYVVLVNSLGHVKVFDLQTSEEKTVNPAADVAESYLASTEPVDDITALTHC